MAWTGSIRSALSYHSLNSWPSNSIYKPTNCLAILWYIQPICGLCSWPGIRSPLAPLRQYCLSLFVLTVLRTKATIIPTGSGQHFAKHNENSTYNLNLGPATPHPPSPGGNSGRQWQVQIKSIKSSTTCKPSSFLFFLPIYFLVCALVLFIYFFFSH